MNEVIFLFDESEIILELSDKIIKSYDLEVGKEISKETFDILKDHIQLEKYKIYDKYDTRYQM